MAIMADLLHRYRAPSGLSCAEALAATPLADGSPVFLYGIGAARVAAVSPQGAFSNRATTSLKSRL